MVIEPESCGVLGTLIPGRGELARAGGDFPGALDGVLESGDLEDGQVEDAMELARSLGEPAGGVGIRRLAGFGHENERGFT
jgi:hypothetical protein